jgi:hypothetical protein
MKERPPSRKGPTTNASPQYSSKIIKAGALLADSKTLLAHWDASATVEENIERFKRENLFGKASRSRVADILAIFRQRYLADESILEALVILTRGKFSTSALERLLYFHSACADRLLRDAVVEILLPMYSKGLVDINIQEFQRTLGKWAEQGRTIGKWSDSTVVRISQGLLASLRDFGVLQGSVNKSIAPAFLSIEAFAYIAFYLKQYQPSGVKVLELPEWKLFFLTRDGVERFLFEAHQRELLEYHVAGSVTRLTFPVDTLGEYANVLAQR